MTFPTGAINTTNIDAGGDSGAAARLDILDAIQKLNLIIANGEPLTLAGTQSISGVKTFVVPPGGVPGRVIGYNYADSLSGALSGTYIPPAGYSWVEVEIQAAGGGGAGAATTTNAQAGGGGGGGGYVRFVMTAAQLGASASFSLAAAGLPGSGGAAGGNAAPSSFAGWIVTGGSGGATPSAESTLGWSQGGAGGGYSPGTGTLLFGSSGRPGENGYWYTATQSSGGRGGHSFMGKGGAGGRRIGAAALTADTCTGFGAGGGGYGSYGSGSSVGGAIGGASWMRVTAYSS